MPKSIPLVPSPELVFAVSGPIGVDIDLVAQRIGASLDSMNYKCRPIKMTDEMFEFDPSIKRPLTSISTYCQRQKYMLLIDFASSKRKAI